MMRRLLVIALLCAAVPATAQDKVPPYWASIASGEAMIRTGPGRNYPGTWLYKRRDLPVRVIKIYSSWRLIEDPDGTRGWMLVTLLSDRRTALVKPGQPRPIHEKRDRASRVAYLVEPGVVGRIEDCDGNWCKLAVAKRAGWIAQGDIYGVAANERVD
ncbi:MAG: SH3 domain-containing protein [Sphingomicrobium sp.]